MGAISWIEAHWQSLLLCLASIKLVLDGVKGIAASQASRSKRILAYCELAWHAAEGLVQATGSSKLEEYLKMVDDLLGSKPLNEGEKTKAKRYAACLSRAAKSTTSNGVNGTK